MNIAAVSIGQPGQTEYYGQSILNRLTLPFQYYTEGWRDIDRETVPLTEKLGYRADRRNKAVERLLGTYPETNHILMIDSFYVKEDEAVRQLIKDYQEAKTDLVLGASIWAKLRTNLSQVVHSRARFYDAWSTPELRWCPHGWRPEGDILTSQELVPMKGFYRVSSVGGCYLFPRWIWDKGSRYGVPYDCHGCEHNFFNKTHDLPIYVDFNVELWRIKKYTLMHCARCSIGNFKRTRL